MPGSTTGLITRKVVLGLSLVLALAVPPVQAASSVPPGPAVNPPSATPQDLGTTGPWFTDQDGKVVVIHGTNMVNKFAPYTPAALGFGEKDLRFLAENGFNSIRLGLSWSAVEPQPGVYDTAYVDEIVALAAAASDHGILPVVNFHQDGYSEEFGGNGAPDWATISYGIPGLTFLPPPANVLPGAAIANENFWRNVKAPDGIGLQDHYAAAWKHVAQRFAGDETTVFELYNEPSPGIVDVAACALPIGCTSFDRKKLAPFYDKVLASVRQVDANRLVFLEPTAFFGLGARTWLPPVADDQVGFAFHNYCALGLVPLPLPPEPCDLITRLTLGNAQKQYKATGQPLLMNEFGAFDSDAVVGNLVGRADEQMMSWMHWAYFAQDFGHDATYGLVNDPSAEPEGANVKTGLLAVLTRPSPRKVAGTPQSWNWNGSASRFRAKYSTARADGGGRFGAGSTSEFFLHPRFFPAGYQVQVTGGTVTSAPNARWLTVAALPGAEQVTLEVTAAPGS